jgi:hypothetical protein
MIIHLHRTGKDYALFLAKSGLNLGLLKIRLKYKKDKIFYLGPMYNQKQLLIEDVEQAEKHLISHS